MLQCLERRETDAELFANLCVFNRFVQGYLHGAYSLGTYREGRPVYGSRQGRQRRSCLTQQALSRNPDIFEPDICRPLAIDGCIALPTYSIRIGIQRQD